MSRIENPGISDGDEISSLQIADSFGLPVYSSQSDVPDLPTGSPVYIEGEGLYIETGT